MRTWREIRARIDHFSTRFASPLALLFAAVAVALRWILDPWLGDAFPLVTLYGAVAVAVLIGGRSRGALTATVGYLVCDYLFIEPRGALGFADTSSLVGALVYVVTCAIVIGLGNTSRRALDEARERGALLQTTLTTLERSERELADFFDNASVALHWVGPDGTILRANQAELDLLGYAREEYVGRHISTFHVDRDVIDAALAQLFRGERLARYPARMRCKNGSIKKVADRLQQPLGTAGSFTPAASCSTSRNRSAKRKRGLCWRPSWTPLTTRL